MGEVVHFPDKSEKPAGIPENAVGVGGTVQPAQASPPVPTETVRVIVTGRLRNLDAQPVENNMELSRGQGAQNGESIAYVWSRIRALGGLIVDDTPSKATFFPIDSFEKITIEVSAPVGNSLA
jgi:hypothetical protein